jgi:translation initiation factor 2 beta subunit (eIF-2beta)/eIF-5
MNVKSPNNTSKWQVRFNSTFKEWSACETSDTPIRRKEEICLAKQCKGCEYNVCVSERVESILSISVLFKSGRVDQVKVIYFVS